MMRFYRKPILSMASAVRLITSPPSTRSPGYNTTGYSVTSIPRPMYFRVNPCPSEKQPVSAPPPDKEQSIFDITSGYYTVPFTKRSRFLIFPTDFHKTVDEECEKRKLSLNILPEKHPQSVRATWILKDIVDVLDKGLVKDCPSYLDGINWNISVIDDPSTKTASCFGRNILFPLNLMENLKDVEVAVDIGHEVAHTVAGHQLDRITLSLKDKPSLNILPEKHPQSVRARCILKDILGLLEKELIKDFNWNISVIDDPSTKRVTCRGGSILVPLKLMENPKDVEVAFDIGYEVAHTVAGDELESDCLLSLRRMCELEADHIGAMLMALAGYDPRTVIPQLEKDKRCGDPYMESNYERVDDWRHSHPSGKKRVAVVAQVMEEAVSIYEQVTAKYNLVPRPSGGLSLIPKAKEL